MLELESLDQTNSSPVNFMVMDLKSQRDIDCLFSRTTAVTVIKQAVATMSVLYFIFKLHLVFVILTCFS
jgi:hypothetical protein